MRVQVLPYRGSLQERGEGENAGSVEEGRLLTLPCLSCYHTGSFQQPACLTGSSFRIFLRDPTASSRQSTAALQCYQSDGIRGVARPGSPYVPFPLCSMPTLVFLFDFL
jgi:hypothetical protein